MEELWLPLDTPILGREVHGYYWPPESGTIFFDKMGFRITMMVMLMSLVVYALSPTASLPLLIAKYTDAIGHLVVTAGDYIGAPRKARYCNAQRAVYTRHKKVHGIK
ncbi:hypothetical protein ACHAXR_009913, partial [Thalassiosira sp. AJA248-18]